MNGNEITGYISILVVLGTALYIRFGPLGKSPEERQRHLNSDTP